MNIAETIIDEIKKNPDVKTKIVKRISGRWWPGYASGSFVRLAGEIQQIMDTLILNRIVIFKAGQPLKIDSHLLHLTKKMNKQQNIPYKPTIKVYCSECHAWVDESETKFIDIAEDIQGADILTFKCPHCKTEQKSRRYG